MVHTKEKLKMETVFFFSASSVKTHPGFQKELSQELCS